MHNLMRVVFLLVLAITLGGCVGNRPTLVVFVGGAGLSQLGDLKTAVSAACPDADVIEISAWDGFRSDVARVINARQPRGVVLIGHSFGCETIARAATQLRTVDLAVLIEPAWDDIVLPRNVQSCLWYQRSEIGMERRAVVHGGGRPITVPGGHNDLPRTPEVIVEVVRFVDRISARHATQERMQHLMRRP